MTTQFPGTRTRPSAAPKTPEQLAAIAEYQAFTGALKAQGGKLWISADASLTRYYFERAEVEYAAEISALREAAGGELNTAWPQKKLGYVDVKTREFVSTRDGVSNADFQKSLGF
jgi:hypothetical protein